MIPLPERTLSILLIAADPGRRATFSEWLAEAPFAASVRAEATFVPDLITADAFTPEVVVVDLQGDAEVPRSLLDQLRRYVSEPTGVLLLDPSASTEDLPMDDRLPVLAHTSTQAIHLHQTVQHLRHLTGWATQLQAAQSEHRRQEANLTQLRAERERAYSTFRRQLADASHDLRSPLNALLGYGEMLHEALEGRGDHSLAKDMQKILALGHRILGIADTMAGQENGMEARMPQDAVDVSPAPSEVRPAPRTASPSEPKEELLLIIDDDDDLRSLIAQYLESEGFQVVTAADGEEGLRLARRHRPDAITLDVEMPGLDGWDVLAHLKADADLALTPVVMLTGRGNEHRAARALRQGADDYLMKGSITAPAIRQAVTGVLEKARLRNADAS